MAKRQKTAQINLRIEPELKKMAEKAASADHRSLTSFIEKLLADYLAQHEIDQTERICPLIIRE